MREPEHIPGTHPPRQGRSPETRAQTRARLYPNPHDREERARYYVQKAKGDREYLKVFTRAPWREPGWERDLRGAHEALACAIAGDPTSLTLTQVRYHPYLYTKCRRVTVPLEMPEPWRSLLIGASLREMEAGIEDLFSDNTPCPRCGFQQSCAACRSRIAARVKRSQAEQVPAAGG